MSYASVAMLTDDGPRLMAQGVLALQRLLAGQSPQLTPQERVAAQHVLDVNANMIGALAPEEVR
ncbi:MAG TPA: hypothetical protein VGN11_09785 [Candidatus Baltobacteraceae bacterium]|nr:hypothetical protein [Candidatus Baltobacteraceae bacterium]